MSDATARCELCGDPIEPDQAALVREGGARAHSGCVYGDADEQARDVWIPPDSPN